MQRLNAKLIANVSLSRLDLLLSGSGNLIDKNGTSSTITSEQKKCDNHDVTP